MIIWDNLKIVNGTSTITVSASGIEGLNDLSIAGNFTAASINGSLNGVVGNIGTSSVPMSGFFNGQLVGATGTFAGQLTNATGSLTSVRVTGNTTLNNVVINGTATLNNLNFNQPINLPANSSIANNPIQFADIMPNDVGVIMLIGTKGFGDHLYLCNCSFETRSFNVQIKTHNDDDAASDTQTINFNSVDPYQWSYKSTQLHYDNVEKISINNVDLILKSNYPSWLEPETGYAALNNYYAYLIQEHNTSTINPRVLQINKNLIGIPYYGILSTITYNHTAHYTIPTQAFTLPTMFSIDHLSDNI